VEELLCERGITVSHEAIRQWCRKVGQDYAKRLRRRRPQPGDTWHLDEVFLTINGERHYLWRAVDQDDNVLDILVQSRRNQHAAKKFFRTLLKGLQYVPRVVITDKLNADFRGLKLTHNGAHVLDGVPGTQKLQCEVFSPLPLGIAESHCTRLPGSSARLLEAMTRVMTSQ
jgi:transposase-like protein